MSPAGEDERGGLERAEREGLTADVSVGLEKAARINTKDSLLMSASTIETDVRGRTDIMGRMRPAYVLGMADLTM